jgi:hypothetical protein
MKLMPTNEPTNDFQNGAVIAKANYANMRSQGFKQSDAIRILKSEAAKLPHQFKSGYNAQVSQLDK